MANIIVTDVIEGPIPFFGEYILICNVTINGEEFEEEFWYDTIEEAEEVKDILGRGESIIYNSKEWYVDE